MTNEEKAKEIGKKFYFVGMNPSEAAYKGALQMSVWKDSEFEKRVTQALCIDCHEYETCEKCSKYNIKKELLRLD